jgi:hypothetical protein
MPHTLRLLLAGVAFLLIVTCGILGTVAGLQIVTAVNRKLPAAQRFEYFDWWLGPRRRLFAEYGRLYPEGPLVARYRTAVRVGMVLVVGVVLLEFFQPFLR